jgi:hypothetical protein
VKAARVVQKKENVCIIEGGDAREIEVLLAAEAH